ncbi:hypothetical protein V9T40_009558 [Parthenolecanium corni]|uniref:Uncharacterized protein n=1 Tax=Parthenolecanium corni TaxID=536013 RepID=A0AAN9Y8X0_9HEMI
MNSAIRGKPSNKILVKKTTVLPFLVDFEIQNWTHAGNGKSLTLSTAAHTFKYGRDYHLLLAVSYSYSYIWSNILALPIDIAKLISSAACNGLAAIRLYIHPSTIRLLIDCPATTRLQRLPNYDFMPPLRSPRSCPLPFSVSCGPVRRYLECELATTVTTSPYSIFAECWPSPPLLSRSHKMNSAAIKTKLRPSPPSEVAPSSVVARYYRL